MCIESSAGPLRVRTSREARRACSPRNAVRVKLATSSAPNRRFICERKLSIFWLALRSAEGLVSVSFILLSSFGCGSGCGRGNGGGWGEQFRHVRVRPAVCLAIRDQEIHQIAIVLQAHLSAGDLDVVGPRLA